MTAQTFATFQIRGAGMGLLSRMESNPDVGPLTFMVACGLAVFSLSAIVMGVGMGGCLLAFAALITHGKLAAIALLILDVIVVTVLGTLSAMVLFE